MVALRVDQMVDLRVASMVEMMAGMRVV